MCEPGGQIAIVTGLCCEQSRIAGQVDRCGKHPWLRPFVELQLPADELDRCCAQVIKGAAVDVQSVVLEPAGGASVISGGRQ